MTFSKYDQYVYFTLHITFSLAYDKCDKPVYFTWFLSFYVQYYAQHNRFDFFTSFYDLQYQENIKSLIPTSGRNYLDVNHWPLDAIP